MQIGYQTIIWGERIPDLGYALDAVAEAGYKGIELAQRIDTLRNDREELSFDDLDRRLHDRSLSLIGLANGTLAERMSFCGNRTGPHYLYVDRWDPHVAPIAIDRGFTLALHVHAYLTAGSLDDASSLLNAHPKLKWLPDTGHLRVIGEDIIRAIQLFPNRLAAVHLKDWTPAYGRSTHRYARGFTELGCGVVPLQRVLRELETMNFDGWLVVEQDHSRSDPAVSLFESAM